MLIATTILLIASIYVGLGMVFGLVFIVAGVNRVDPAAHGAGVLFRLLILPGVVALWPLLLKRWLIPRPAEGHA